MKFPIALQLYSVRDDVAADFAGTLKKVAEMGYDGVEFAGLFNHSAAEVKKICAELGLIPISAHVSYGEMAPNPALLETYAEIGCKYVVIPWMNGDYLPGGEKFPEFKESVKLLGEKATSLGMKLCYHNHDFEFEKVDGEYKLDLLYKNIPAEYLQVQPDTCWVNVGGANPAEYILKYSGRVGIIHLKDFVGTKGENMYGLIGADGKKPEKSTGEFQLRPVGSGVQDFPAILAAAEKAGTKWTVVEQDSPSMGKTPLECAKSSIDYLRSL